MFQNSENSGKKQNPVMKIGKSVPKNWKTQFFRNAFGVQRRYRWTKNKPEDGGEN